MAFEIVLTKKAKHDLEGIDGDIAKRIVKKLVWWQKQDNPTDYAKRLHEPMTGDIRFRVGDYRIICVINNRSKRIEIVKIGHRRNVYK